MAGWHSAEKHAEEALAALAEAESSAEASVVLQVEIQHWSQTAEVATERLKAETEARDQSQMRAAEALTGWQIAERNAEDALAALAQAESSAMVSAKASAALQAENAAHIRILSSQLIELQNAEQNAPVSKSTVPDEDSEPALQTAAVLEVANLHSQVADAQILTQLELTAMQAEMETVVGEAAEIATGLLDEALEALSETEDGIAQNFIARHAEREAQMKSELQFQLLHLLEQQETASELVDVHRNHSNKLEQHFSRKMLHFNKQHHAASTIQSCYRHWKFRALLKTLRKKHAQTGRHREALRNADLETVASASSDQEEVTAALRIQIDQLRKGQVDFEREHGRREAQAASIRMELAAARADAESHRARRGQAEAEAARLRAEAKRAATKEASWLVERRQLLDGQGADTVAAETAGAAIAGAAAATVALSASTGDESWLAERQSLLETVEELETELRSQEQLLAAKQESWSEEQQQLLESVDMLTPRAAQAVAAAAGWTSDPLENGRSQAVPELQVLQAEVAGLQAMQAEHERQRGRQEAVAASTVRELATARAEAEGHRARRTKAEAEVSQLRAGGGGPEADKLKAELEQIKAGQAELERQRGRQEAVAASTVRELATARAEAESHRARRTKAEAEVSQLRVEATRAASSRAESADETGSASSKYTLGSESAVSYENGATKEQVDNANENWLDQTEAWLLDTSASEQHLTNHIAESAQAVEVCVAQQQQILGQFRDADADHDGLLTRDELVTTYGAESAGQLMEIGDTNHDVVLDLAEFSAALDPKSAPRPPSPSLDIRARRRHSVAVEKAQAASGSGMGVFSVEQSHLPDVSREVDLEVGKEGITLFSGAVLVQSILYNEISKWNYETSSATFFVQMAASTQRIALLTRDGNTIGRSMRDHAISFAATMDGDNDHNASSSDRRFTVMQTHLPKAPPDVALSVGRRCISLFNGSALLTSYLYANLEGWTFAAKEATLVIKVKTGEQQTVTVGLVTPDGPEIGKLMQEQAMAVAAIEAPKMSALGLVPEETRDGLDALDALEAELSPKAVEPMALVGVDVLDELEKELTPRATDTQAVEVMAEEASGTLGDDALDNLEAELMSM